MKNSIEIKKYITACFVETERHVTTTSALSQCGNVHVRTIKLTTYGKPKGSHFTSVHLLVKLAVK